MSVSAVAGTMPSYMTPKLLAVRNEWYRKLEREGMDIDEVGFRPHRLRRRKGIPLGNMAIYSTARSESESPWDLDAAEYWRLMSAEVEALPDCYRGKAFLRRWAEIGDVRTAGEDTGCSRWHARKIHERFIQLLKRKRVLK